VRTGGTGYTATPLLTPPSQVSDTCGDWTSSFSRDTSSVGVYSFDSGSFFSLWEGTIDSTENGCGRTLPIYCLQQ
jgi:hypothetical protein